MVRTELPDSVKQLLAEAEKGACWFCLQSTNGRGKTNIHHVFAQNHFPEKRGNNSGVRVHITCHPQFNAMFGRLHTRSERKYMEKAERIQYGYGIFAKSNDEQTKPRT